MALETDSDIAAPSIESVPLLLKVTAFAWAFNIPRLLIESSPSPPAIEVAEASLSTPLFAVKGARLFVVIEPNTPIAVAVEVEETTP